MYMLVYGCHIVNIVFKATHLIQNLLYDIVLNSVFIIAVALVP